jgi:hypothetical protein
MRKYLFILLTGIIVFAQSAFAIPPIPFAPLKPGTIGSTTPGLGYFTYLYHGAGAVGTPSLTFTADTNTGFYWISADRVGLSLGNSLEVDFGAATTTFSNDIVATSFTTPQSADSSDLHRFREDSDNGTNYIQVQAPDSILENSVLRIPSCGTNGGSQRAAMGVSATSTVSSTTTATIITGCTKTITDDTFTAGKVITIHGYGTIAGANDTKVIGLYCDSTAVATITLAAAIVGDFEFEFMMIAQTISTQLIGGHVSVSADGVTAGHTYVNVDLTGTVDFSAGNVVVAVKETTTNATDDITGFGLMTFDHLQ